MSGELSGRRAKVAVVLVVKDEAEEILAWLAWYAAVGCDAIIVHDDGSTDGTWELLEHAARSGKVRARRIPQTGSFFDRQRDAFVGSLREGMGEFDWMGFFDADEYLALYAHPGVHAFLDRPDDVGLVSINWCNYASGGHVFRPGSLPFVAYTSHLGEAQPVNRHVKSFVRPRAWNGEWVNPHMFPVGEHRTVDPAGRDVTWREAPGIGDAPPDWSIAKVMHFQCRSMEHFMARLAKRPDLPARTETWREYDQPDATDERALQLESRIRTSIFSTLLSAPPVLVELLQRCHGRAGGGAPDYRLVLPRGSEGRCLVLDREQGRLCMGDGAAGERDAVHGLVFPGTPERIVLLRPFDIVGPLGVHDDARIVSTLVFDIVPVEGDRVAFREPRTGRPVGIAPSLGDALSIGRRFAGGWEGFTLETIPRETISGSVPLAFLDRVAGAPDRAAAVSATFGTPEAPITMALLPAWLELLDPGSRATVTAGLKGFDRYLF